MLDRSLEITEVLRGVGGDGDRKPACTFFWIKDRKSKNLSRLSVNEFNLS